jgi:UDP-N-acetylglucosamine 1-carboxyvinyltransferase
MKKARISLPGGCFLGPRPIDLHISALRRLGVDIFEDHGFLDCNCPAPMKGAEIALSIASVGATENIMLAAATAEGITVINNAAKEPEIVDLQNFLNAMGAKISGAQTGTITVEGVRTLHGAEYTVIPDRIVAATYLMAGGITGGEVTVTDIIPQHIKTVTSVLSEAGFIIEEGEDYVRLASRGPILPVKSLRTAVYPGFPTDAQPPLMALLCIARGSSVFVENIFEGRYNSAIELKRMGADITVEGRVAVVEGVPSLMAADVTATDLRGGAAVVLAALAASGNTKISNAHLIDRGYEDIAAALGGLGGQLTINS